MFREMARERLQSNSAGRTPLCVQLTEEHMSSRSQSAPTRRTRIITVALSALALMLTSATSLPAQEKEKGSADAEFLTKVVPSIAASVQIIEYEVKHTSDATVKEFAERVLDQHKGSVKTATGHAKRLNVAVDTEGNKESKEMLDKLSKLKGTEMDVAFLEWLGHIHHDTALFDNEVKNGTDAELKTYAKNSITAGNEHLKEAHELLAKLKK